MGGNRIKICFGQGKSELPVKNLSGDVEAIKFGRFSFPNCKKFRRQVWAGDRNLGVIREESG